jgi:hypothetical protein
VQVGTPIYFLGESNHEPEESSESLAALALVSGPISKIDLPRIR